MLRASKQNYLDNEDLNLTDYKHKVLRFFLKFYSRNNLIYMMYYEGYERACCSK